MDDGAAGGGDYDACECVWSHEMATRRIINMIRQTQDYCTENECITDGNGAPGAGGNGGGSDNMAMFFIGFWFLMAIVLYFLRPKRAVPPGKGHDQSGPNFDPPAPTAS